MDETLKQESLNQIKREAAEVAVDIDDLRADLIDLSEQIRIFHEEVQAAGIPRLALALVDARSRISAAADYAAEACAVIPAEGKGNADDG